MSGVNQEPPVPEKHPAESTSDSKGAEVRPKLLFQPDPHQERRIARFRRLVLVATAVIVGTALVVVLRTQPRVPEPRPAPVPVPSVQSPPPQESSPHQIVNLSPSEDNRSNLVTVATKAVAEIDSAVASATARWQRTQDLVPSIGPAAEQLEQAFTRVRRARSVAESAAVDLKAARQAAERIKETSRRPGLDGYRLSILYTAAQTYLDLLTADFQDRLAYLDATAQAFQALGDSDQNEYEIKQNVANSYARKIAIRQHRIRQAKQQMGEQLEAVRLAR